jgi:hypothetical protein
MANKTLKTIISAVGAGILELLSQHYAAAQDAPKTDGKKIELIAPAQQEQKRDYSKNAQPRYPENPPALRAIVNGKFYSEKDDNQDQMQYSGTGKFILDFGAPSIVAYAHAGELEQKFDTTDVHGSRRAASLGANLYAPLSSELSLFGEGSLGFSTKEYDVKSTVSNAELNFGSDAGYVNFKLGLTEKKLDSDDYGVGNRHSWLLVQGTKYFGDATGDVTEDYGTDYDATDLRAQARWMIPGTDFSLEAAVSSFSERTADFLKQDDFGFQFGPRYHFGGNGYVEALALWNKEKSELAGEQSTEDATGFKVAAGWRIFDGCDLNAFYSFLSGDKQDSHAVGVGATLYLGGKK